ncbi:hypothetical protein V1512DRAFT_257632 [Lipomyces arxii]|uniref:uncharacterized protein n=1 Tax=Lipomyces arxii TaxID=56418 RepID=UPI0034CF06ED
MLHPVGLLCDTPSCRLNPRNNCVSHRMDASQFMQNMTDLRVARVLALNKPSKFCRRLRTVMHACGLACAAVAIVIFANDINIIKRTPKTSRGIGKEATGITISAFSIVVSAVKTVPKLDMKTRKLFPFAALEAMCFLVYTVATANGGPTRSQSLGTKEAWVVTLCLFLYWSVAAVLGYRDSQIYVDNPDVIPPDLITPEPFTSNVNTASVYGNPNYKRSNLTTLIKGAGPNVHKDEFLDSDSDQTLPPQMPESARQPNATVQSPFEASTIFAPPGATGGRRRRSSPLRAE